MHDKVNYVFVYGTLLRGAPNHGRYCIDALTIEPASTAGRLYDLLGGRGTGLTAPGGPCSCGGCRR